MRGLLNHLERFAPEPVYDFGEQLEGATGEMGELCGRFVFRNQRQGVAARGHDDRCGTDVAADHTMVRFLPDDVVSEAERCLGAGFQGFDPVPRLLVAGRKLTRRRLAKAKSEREGYQRVARARLRLLIRHVAYCACHFVSDIRQQALVVP